MRPRARNRTLRGKAGAGARWAKLKAQPNLIYTDGNAFSLWRDGEPAAKLVQLDGDVESAGAKLAAPATLMPLITDFLGWQPIPPRTAPRLAEVTARLCRLLRDEVTEQMALGSPGLTALATDWRKLLFPEADDAQFADGYAQAITFGLLVARRPPDQRRRSAGRRRARRAGRCVRAPSAWFPPRLSFPAIPRGAALAGFPLSRE